MDKEATLRTGEEPVFADLDAIIEEPLYVRLHGKKLTIKPLSLDAFLRVANGYESMHKRTAEGDVNEKELIRMYYNLFHSICDEITIEDVANMTQGQSAALMHIVLDKITGRMGGDEYRAALEKKKT